MDDLAVLALTPRGQDLAKRIVQSLGNGVVVDASGSTREILEKTFKQGRPMVCIMAIGIVIRAVGSLVQDKKTDSPIVVVDEAGTFAVSVLGGHLAGANQLANEVASAIGAKPVITTASDALELPAVDMIGRQWGWKIEHGENLTRVAAAVVQGKRVGVYQDAGRPDWWKPFGSWPHHFEHLESLPTQAQGLAAVLVITDRVIPSPASGLLERTIVYRPPTLALGVGCRRNVPCEEIEECVRELFTRHGLYFDCLAAVGTAAIKKDEPGLIDFTDQHELPLLSYSEERLTMFDDLPTPSDKVRDLVGVPGVCEPAALLAAGVKELAIPKTKFERVCLAVARRAVG